MLGVGNIERMLLPAVCTVMLLSIGIGCTRDSGAAAGRYPFFRWVGEQGLRPGQFQKPRSVAGDGGGGFYVVDMTGRVQHLSLDGRWLGQWQMPEIELGKPKGLALGEDGGVWVGEPHYSRMNLFAPDGVLKKQWGQFGLADVDLTFPRDVVWDGGGHLFLVEYGHFHRVRKFTVEGELLHQWGSYGEEPGAFKRPEGLAWSTGRLYVADACNHRVQLFDGDGRLLQVIGEAGNGPGQMRFPYDVAVDATGRLYVCEYGNSRISVFDPDGRWLGMFGLNADPALDLLNPWSIDLVAPEGALIVADSNHHRILVVETEGLLAYWEDRN